jgi:uncharacterized protein YprB with RNaseH-like and TPR domain
MSPAPLHHILFLDIETVPQFPSYESLPDGWKTLWDTKSTSLMRYHEGESNESLYPRAAIYAEFGKIICISCGVLQGQGSQRRILLKSFYGDQEKILLKEFVEMLEKWAGGETRFLCAHNGKEFDFPYICRRLLINGMTIPSILNIAGKKPWDVCHYDTMELWKFGDFKNYTSLNLLSQSLGIPSPKDDIDGSMVWQLYWSGITPEEKAINLKRIVTYCQKDVTAVAQVFLKMHGESMIEEENIQIKA